jgi:hypothetical protein
MTVNAFAFDDDDMTTTKKNLCDMPITLSVALPLWYRQRISNAYNSGETDRSLLPNSHQRLVQFDIKTSHRF